MTVVASTFSNNFLSELHVKYFSRTFLRVNTFVRIICRINSDEQKTMRNLMIVLQLFPTVKLSKDSNCVEVQ